MNECMETDRPLVSILLAVYEPNLEWFREQLLSLNRQTYSHLCLYVRDDASPTVSFEEIQSCLRDCISAFPVVVHRNEKNLGSNLTFQQLTQEADGTYFTYCDQDDVWLPEKVETLVRELESRNAALVCSDVAVIDGQGNRVAGSICEVRPRHMFQSGEQLAQTLLYRNFVIGCTMLISSKLAKEACPFVKSMVHDHYLAFYAALRGTIYVSPAPLVKYRIHGGNQTGVLSRITTKEEYAQKHLGLFVDRIGELSGRFSLPELAVAQQWARARQENYAGKISGAYHLWKLRKINAATSYFELVGLRLPNFLFRWAVRLIQQGKFRERRHLL